MQTLEIDSTEKCSFILSAFFNTKNRFVTFLLPSCHPAFQDPLSPLELISQGYPESYVLSSAFFGFGWLVLCTECVLEDLLFLYMIFYTTISQGSLY